MTATNERPADVREMYMAHDMFRPLIEKYVTAAEWNRMVEEGAAGFPPERMPLLLGFMMYEGDREAIQLAIDQMPPELRPVIGGIAGEAFATHSELVHGTLTPPRGGRG